MLDSFDATTTRRDSISHFSPAGGKSAVPARTAAPETELRTVCIGSGTVRIEQRFRESLVSGSSSSVTSWLYGSVHTGLAGKVPHRCDVVNAVIDIGPPRERTEVDGAQDLLIIDMNGESLHVVGSEDFIAMKLSASGPLDLRDARQAYYMDLLDITLLKNLTRNLGRGASAPLEAIVTDIG